MVGREISRRLKMLQLVTLLGVAGFSCQTAAESLGSARAELMSSTPNSEGLSDLGRDLTAVACSKMLDCCSPAEIDDRVHASVTSTSTCQATLQPRYDAYVDRVANSASAGHVAYHGDRAKRCLAALQAQTCGDYATQHFTGPAAGSDCDTWLEPGLANGVPCDDDYECVSGECAGRQVQADGSVSSGKCVARAALGQACEASCVAGAFCDTTTQPATCLPAQGVGAECSDPEQCQSGICDGPVGATTCRAAAVSCLGK